MHAYTYTHTNPNTHIQINHSRHTYIVIFGMLSLILKKIIKNNEFLSPIRIIYSLNIEFRIPFALYMFRYSNKYSHKTLQCQFNTTYQVVLDTLHSRAEYRFVGM